MKISQRAGQLALLVAALALLLPTLAFAAEQPIEIEYSPDVIVWHPNTEWKLGTLTINGPDCLYMQFEFHRGQTIFLKPYDASGEPLVDGTYSFDLQLGPGAEVRGLFEEYGQGQLCRGREDLPPLEVLTSTGYVSVIEKRFVDPFKEEDPRLAEQGVRGDGFDTAGSDGGEPIAFGSAGMVLAGDGMDEPRSMSAGVVLTNSDGVIRNSLCVGFDCPNSPSFSFDTVRLQENNLRIHFDDTSTISGFPNHDWRLIANDSASGGANKFSIADSSASRTPFTVEGNAPSHSLYVDDGGRVGLGTSTPVVELHVKDGDTPTLRLEQDTSSGFAAQTWDVAGNETSFFIRDATNGSTLPFRIQPGAASNLLFIAASDNIGLGTTSPDATLHVRRTDGTAQVHIEDTGAAEIVLTLESTGVTTRFQIDNGNSPGSAPSFSIGQRQNGNFIITEDGSGVDEFSIAPNGDILVGGAVVHTSSRALKHDIEPVDARAVLDRVAAMPIAEWTYNHDEEGRRHMGPMAEDFWSTFGLGRDNVTLAPMDTAGVALAAIQGLNQIVSAKDVEIDELRAENQRKDEQLQDLNRRLERLEALLP